MKSRLFLSLVFYSMLVQCQAQEKKQKTDFEKFIESFVEMKIPSNYKKSTPSSKIQEVNMKDALRYFNLTENDLRFNDYSYDFDEDIKYDNWVIVLPHKQEKISNKNHVALIYSIDRNSELALDTGSVTLTTFTYSGVPIDKIVIRSHYTRENDWRDVVFLTKDTFRIFNYLTNLENYNVKGGIYYLIDENAPRTVVETEDYQIDENGKIKHIKTYPKQYLKKFVSFYRDYHADSDDPMNDY